MKKLKKKGTSKMYDIIDRKIENTANSEEFQNDVVDQLKGLLVVIQSLECAEEMGTHTYQKESYNLLGNIVLKLINESTNYQETIIELDRKIEELSKNIT